MDEIRKIYDRLNSLILQQLQKIYFYIFQQKTTDNKEEIIKKLIQPLKTLNNNDNEYQYLLENNPKKLNINYRKGRLNNVTFYKTKFGQVEKFQKILERKIGKNWEKQVLDISNELNIPGIRRLGKPGRQGTVIELEHKNKKYAIKVTQKGVKCGDGATGGMGFLKQARMQEIAAEYDITCHIYAVYCGDKKESSFMVMDVMGERLIDLYRNNEMSQKHQEQLWNLYKKLDSEVGIIHNDDNPLNIMTDINGNIKIIDFDRSKIIEYKDIHKWGKNPNIRFLPLRRLRHYNISANWLKQKYKDFKQNNYQV